MSVITAYSIFKDLLNFFRLFTFGNQLFPPLIVKKFKCQKIHLQKHKWSKFEDKKMQVDEIERGYGNKGLFNII